jgi:hypothetical protein
VPPADQTQPATPGRRIAERAPRRSAGRAVVVVVVLVGLAGATALGLAVAGVGPPWLDGAGASAAVSVMAWLLAVRTGGRPVVAALLAAVLGTVAVVVDTAWLRTGAAVLTATTAGVLGVMVTVPAVRFVSAVREAVIASLIAAVGAVAVLGFEPTVSAPRFELVSLGLAFGLVLVLVNRLGAGLHGLGRRGLLVVVAGAVVLLVSLLYGQLLQRYGAESVRATTDAVVAWSRARLGAFPRPLMALLGVPALVWGCHMRARRRQGWWACAFGVAATTAVAQALIDPRGSWLEGGLEVLYGLAVGVVVAYVVVRADLALTAPRGRRGRRAEEAAAHRPEPRRFAEL